MTLYVDVNTKNHIKPELSLLFIDVDFSCKTSTDDPLLLSFEMVASSHLQKIYQFGAILCSQEWCLYK